MKRILILLILLFSSPALAGVCMMGGGGTITEGEGGCTTSNDSAIYNGSSGSTTGVSYWAAMATQFTFTGTKTITEYTITVANYSGSAAATASLYTDSSGEVGTIIEGTSKQITISSNGTKTFTLDTPKTGLTAGTYWLYVTSPSGNWSNIELDGGGRVLYDGGYYNLYHMNSQVMGCAE